MRNKKVAVFLFAASCILFCACNSTARVPGALDTPIGTSGGAITVAAAVNPAAGAMRPGAMRPGTARVIFNAPPVIRVDNTGRYTWVLYLKNNVPSEPLRCSIEVQNALNGQWQRVAATEDFLLAGSQVYTKEVPFTRSGSKSRVRLISAGAALLSREAQYPVNAGDISALYFTDRDGTIVCTVTVKNTGTIPLVFARLGVGRGVGAGYVPAADTYVFSPALYAGQSRTINIDTTLTAGKRMKLELTAKYSEADSAWQMLDQTFLTLSPAMIKNFFDNLSFDVVIDQHPDYHKATVSVRNNNIIPAEDLFVRGYSHTPGCHDLAGECAVYAIQGKSIAPGQSFTGEMSWWREYRSDQFKATLEYKGKEIKEKTFPLLPTGVRLDSLTVTRTSPTELSWRAVIKNDFTAGCGVLNTWGKRCHGDNHWIDVDTGHNCVGVPAGGTLVRQGTFNATLAGRFKFIIEGGTCEGYAPIYRKIIEQTVDFQ